MIEVTDLTKRYAGRVAVSHVSFQVGKGQIVGLLGPNGAGKSTILKILSCFLPASAGTVKVAGLDVFHEADEVRRRIGYMPEHNPLPLDMRVREYLKFRARLKGLSRSASRDRVDVVLNQCSLLDVQKRIIGQLSKGFRQRVGLADALVHEPDLVILDEPTIGLDPNQLRAVRQLIKELGKRHTILLSTHILPEVEMTCSHVLMLDHGRIVASDSTEDLLKRVFHGGPVITEVLAPREALLELLSDRKEIESLDVSPMDGDWNRVIIQPSNGHDLRAWLHGELAHPGWQLRELSRGRHTLEDVFVKLTRTEKEE